MLETLAIIPARGGSKGVPRKNVLPIAGKPLIAYSIERALEAQSVNRVVVSTDDAEIAAVAMSYGAEVVWRPAEISGDTASSESALLHTIEYLREQEGYQPDLLVFLQCTSPLIVVADIDGTVQALLDEEADTALAVTRFHSFLWSNSPDGATAINHDASVRLRRQENETQFLETGAVYVMRADGFREAKHRFFGRKAIYEMPRSRSIEIDDQLDVTIVETLLREHQRQNRNHSLPKPVKAVVLDFDGVFTDNRVMVFQDGHEAVICHRGDGMGLSKLVKSGIPVLVISTEANPIVKVRCDKMGIPCFHGIDDKLSTLTHWLGEQGIGLQDVVYLGNDINDIACLQAVGCGVVVNDAHPDAKSAAQCILSERGGEGVIRELVDLVLGGSEHVE